MNQSSVTGPISAVITTFNDGPMLEEALHSVAKQTVLPREILVIDDGSKPATAPKIIDRIAKEYRLDVKYKWQSNAGISAARNAGLQLSSQEFVAFLDADDIWLPEHLEHKLERLRERGPTYSTSYDGYVEFDHNSRRLLRTIASGSYDGPICAKMLGIPGGVPAGMQFQLHRRAALESVDAFDETLRVHEDFDLLLRLGKAGFQITGSGAQTVWRRVHPASITRRDPQWTLNEMERFNVKAEREKLLSSHAVARKRKWTHLTVGKQQVRDETSLRQGIKTLKTAFQYGRPEGIREWAIFVAASNPILAYPSFGLYRIVSGQWNT
jgi:glycosyltransferase involved in cell wall biosynthesis